MMKNNDKISLFLPDEPATQALGQKLAENLQAPFVIYLSGDLGAGKTTFVRALLRALGVTGAIKSPTFALVEPYVLSDCACYHFDLYRLVEPEEIEYIGFRDYFSTQSLCLVEWPEKAVGILPNSDITLNLSIAGRGRDAIIEAHSERGLALLSKLAIQQQ